MRKGYGEGPSDIKMIFFCILSSIINDIYIYENICFTFRLPFDSLLPFSQFLN